MPEEVTTTSPEPVTPQKQRELYKNVGYKTQQVGECWYPISAKWYKSWVEYTAYNKKDDDIDGGVENLHLRDIPKPGPIDNEELADPEDKSQLKKQLDEHLTHEWLHSEQWKLLHSWYGGGPEFPRFVYERGTTYSREKYINMYPKFLRYVEVNADGTYDLQKYSVQSFPEQYTLQELVTKLEGTAEGEDNEKPRVHLWLPFEHVKKAYPIETTKGVVVTAENLKNEDPNRYVEIPDDNLSYSLSDVQIPKDVVILVEKVRDIPKPQNSKTKSDEDEEDEEEEENGEGNDQQEQNKNNNAQPDTTAPTEPNNENNNNAVEKSEDEKFPWPLVKGPSKWKQLQVGDILDIQDGNSKWYEAYIRYIPKEGEEHFGEAAVHFIGWPTKWDEWVPIGDYKRYALRHTHTKGKPYRPSKKSSYGSSGYSSSYSGGYSSWYDSHERGAPKQKGVVGLCNLGNTCFMNSTIQCLAQSPYLTEYFLRGDFVHHINYNNPLGWKGKVAQAWAQLLKDMFSNQYRVVAPREFKTAIGEVAPRFMGYSQQDSQELLSFLLDGLHEDLNQIQNKPPTDPVESNGRPDEVVAAEAWRAYLKRNVSIVVDLLQGQYKSRVECPDCDRVSITFDPYMFLSVPLPTERYKTMEFTWVGVDPNVPPTVYGIKMLKVADISMFKKAVAKQFNVSADDLYVCDVWKSKIHRELKNRFMIAEINRRNDDIVVYYAPKPQEPIPVNTENTETEKDKEKDADKDKEKDKNEQRPEKEKNGEGNPKRGYGEYDDDDDEEYYSHSGARGRGMNYKQQPEAIPDFKAFHITLQTPAATSHHNVHYREENENIGMPLWITLPMKRKITCKEAREKIFEVIKPYLTNKDKPNSDENENETTNGTDKETNPNTNSNENEKNKEKDQYKIPFSFFAAFGYNSVLNLEAKDDEALPLTEQGFKFILYFQDRSEYNEEICVREQRVRHESALPPLNRDNYMDDEDRSSDKPVSLATCIDSFTEEEILDENDAWYCNKCSAFKCARKKIDLWSSPDLLIIHLKRFSYTRQWRDRINTVVKFPLEGFDLSPWVTSEENKRDAIYDLYAISNHMGSMGGGHYTAYAKNLENQKWYELDDTHATEVHEPESMISSSAYVLYYKRRKPREMKHRASRVQIPNVETRKPQTEETTTSNLAPTPEKNETSEQE